MSRPTRHGLVALALGAVLAALTASPAGAQTITRTISYHGLRLRVPNRWPVFRLAAAPRTCVRFNRHAVYLGTPGVHQNCPASAWGRSEAILVSPVTGRGVRELATPAAAQPLGGSELQRRHGGVMVTATWGADPRAIARALGLRSLGRDQGVGRGSTAAPAVARRPTARTAAARPPVARTAATTFTGLGFDTCQDPSPNQLNAWLSSGYGAVGTYIGGANMGCSQPNLSAANVTAAVTAGWHLIPTYVGLQAPGNSCGCASIAPAKAAAQGTAAAQDAVARATAVGIGSGSPIYFDMEAYPTGASATHTVLSFLAAWTTELHALGYLSGVYSSSDSGIRDLAAVYGTSGSVSPDEIWSARWDDVQSTADANLTASDWPGHQRIHQYAGGHNETYAKVTLNIDGDYVDAATVGTATNTPPVVAPAPLVSVAPQPDGSVRLRASWSGMSGIAGWRLLGGFGSAALGSLSGTRASSAITTHSAYPYYAEQAYDAAGRLLGVSAATPAPAHLAIYGGSVFVPAGGGLAGLPVGCFTGADCRLTTTVTAGRTVIATTGAERVGTGRSGIVYFAPTAVGRRLLLAAPGHRLAVTVTAVDGSGTRATRRLTLIPYATAGHGPPRSVAASASIAPVGTTDFVNRNGTGGILAACASALPCRSSLTLRAGTTLIASTGAEFMGANELGYVSFRLTAAGRALLAAASGNQLGVELTLRNGADTASGRIVLVRFS